MVVGPGPYGVGVGLAAPPNMVVGPGPYGVGVGMAAPPNMIVGPRPYGVGVGIPSLVNGRQLTPFNSGPISPQINFYNPLTGQRGPSVVPGGILPVNPFDRVVTNFNSGNINVDISGTKQNVNNAMNLLRGSSSSTIGPNSWMYILNPRDATKKLLVSPNPTVKFSGSGVILFECKFFNQVPYGPQICKPTILLVKTLRNGEEVFEEMGGEFDSSIVANDDTMRLNAGKELNEESQSLFKIATTNLERIVEGRQLFVDVLDNATDSFYRSYFIFIAGTENLGLSDMYLLNKTKIAAKNPSGLPQSWQETLEMRRFFIEDLYNAISGGRSICPDVDGAMCKIRDRTINCLKSLRGNRDGVSTAYRNPIKISAPTVDTNQVYTFNL
jgi:hypothetical protein